MSSNNDLDLHEIYHSSIPEMQPPELIDARIRMAARKSFDSQPAKSKLVHLRIPLAIAASLVIGVTVVTKLYFYQNTQQEIIIHKSLNNTPMSSLQRSRHQPAELWLQRVENLLAQDEIAQARLMMKQFQRDYPDYPVDADLLSRLSADRTGAPTNSQ